MSSHEEIFRGVTVIWNKETGSLDIIKLFEEY